MPYAPDSVIGLTALTTIKFAGYSLFGRYLNKLYKPEKTTAFTFGLVRTILGLFVGAVAASLCLVALNLSLPVFLLLLIPIRYGEWLCVILSFFNRNKIQQSNKLYKQLTTGVVWSFVLDIPVIASLLVIPGGVWVC